MPKGRGRGGDLFFLGLRRRRLGPPSVQSLPPPLGARSPRLMMLPWLSAPRPSFPWPASEPVVTDLDDHGADGVILTPLVEIRVEIAP